MNKRNTAYSQNLQRPLFDGQTPSSVPKELGDLQKRRNASCSLEKGCATLGNLRNCTEFWSVRYPSQAVGFLVSTPSSRPPMSGRRFLTPLIAETRRRIAGDRLAMAEPGSVE